MPKEVVQYPRTDHNSGTEISVHWSKDSSHVQLAVTRHVWIPGSEADPNTSQQNGRIHADHNLCNHCYPSQGGVLTLSEARALEADSPTPASQPPDPPATVYTDVLSRNEINRMIRSLRRARDQAYGADA